MVVRANARMMLMLNDGDIDDKDVCGWMMLMLNDCDIDDKDDGGGWRNVSAREPPDGRFTQD